MNKIMVRMGNACTCCRSLYNSSNMKSAVSSSSSGSEKVSVSGVASGSGYEIEETKSKTNSRMSCASDDSCAINELLEGRMDLTVTLPNSANPVVINVERRTPMLDLLVNISTQYRFNAANYTINAGDHEFKASTPIGTLDVNQISIIPKNVKSGSNKGNTPPVIPFQTTFRLQVNLPRNQLMVMRVTPNASIAAIKQIICSEKSLDTNKYQLVRFSGKSEGPHILDPNKSPAYYTLNEVTLVSNKDLAKIELQYGNPGASQVDMCPSMNETLIKKSIISQSNPDFSTIEDKTVLSHTNSKLLKKRPAPPPPMSSSATLPNKVFSSQKTQNNGENKSNDRLRNDSNLKSDETVSQTLQTFVESKPISRVSKSVTHVRQNSGSDSSGYHESVLSSDSPESSSATTLPKSSSLKKTETMSSNDSKQTNNQKSGVKKRRAPPPPTTLTTQDSKQTINGHIHSANDINDESKVVLECMSDVSLPLSTSSSSSGTASDINNRSLSPIVITESNGSSTPIHTNVNYMDPNNSLESESTQCSSVSDNQREESNDIPVLSVENKSKQINTISDESGVNVNNDAKDSELQQKTNHIIVSKEQKTNQSIVETNPSIEETSIGLNDRTIRNETNGSDNETNSKSTESLPKAEVSCTAPALAFSHDTELSGHDCSEQVVEVNASNIVDKEESDGNQNLSDNLSDNQTNELAIDSTLNNTEMDLEEMSITLPPPSPFQNRTEHKEINSSSPDCRDEGHLIVEQSVLNTIPDSSETIIKALSHKNTLNQQMITNSDNLVTIEESIDSTIDTKPTDDCIQTTNTPIIVSEEDSINKEIEVTLQSLNEELDRLDNCSQFEPSVSVLKEETAVIQTTEGITETINRFNENIDSNNTNVSSEVNPIHEIVSKSPEIQSIREMFEKKQSPVPSPTPSPTPRVMSTLNKVSNNESNNKNRTDSKNQFPISTNGKTTLFINNSQSQTTRPLSPPTTSESPSPTNEDKLSITDEVRQVCRPRVRLTNFSIGSYKKEVDIFEDTPMTAPVKSLNKSYVTFPSVKKAEKSVAFMDPSKSKIDIKADSMTTTPTTSESKVPVITPLVTSGPKISRIQSWSPTTLQEKHIKQPVKTNERYVSQISITKEPKDSIKESNEVLKSPNPTIQSLNAKILEEIKNRSPSPKEVTQKTDTNKERVTISIKPGSESVIRSNSKQNSINNTINNSNKVQQNDSQKKVIIKTNSFSKNNKNIVKEPVRETAKQPNKQLVKDNTAQIPPPVPPPIPPPIPPPVPQTISSLPTNNSLKNKINTKIFHTKGWNSERVTRSGEVPKVKHVEPPTNVNVRDQLLNEIKGFGGKNSLKKVSNNSRWKLEVNSINA